MQLEKMFYTFFQQIENCLSRSVFNDVQLCSQGCDDIRVEMFTTIGQVQFTDHQVFYTKNVVSIGIRC
jgi:hypothetical protein